MIKQTQPAKWKVEFPGQLWSAIRRGEERLICIGHGRILENPEFFLAATNDSLIDAGVTREAGGWRYSVPQPSGPGLVFALPAAVHSETSLGLSGAGRESRPKLKLQALRVGKKSSGQNAFSFAFTAGRNTCASNGPVERKEFAIYQMMERAAKIPKPHVEAIEPCGAASRDFGPEISANIVDRAQLFTAFSGIRRRASTRSAGFAHPGM